jgi:hypothetical protein
VERLPRVALPPGLRVQLRTSSLGVQGLHPCGSGGLVEFGDKAASEKWASESNSWKSSEFSKNFQKVLGIGEILVYNALSALQ